MRKIKPALGPFLDEREWLIPCCVFGPTVTYVFFKAWSAIFFVFQRDGKYKRTVNSMHLLASGNFFHAGWFLICGCRGFLVKLPQKNASGATLPKTRAPFWGAHEKDKYLKVRVWALSYYVTRLKLLGDRL